MDWQPSTSAVKGKTLLVFRHGERIDFTFDTSHESWVHRCFDQQGRYRRTNINMPRSLPARKDGHGNFALDTPLTEIGYLQAKLSGRALREAGVSPTVLYVSPALRCVQTAVGLLKGMQMNGQPHIEMLIEPALFEWGGWFRQEMPRWMPPDELAELGYPIKQSYKPMLTEVTSSETLSEYYDRSHAFAKKAIQNHANEESSTIVFVAHGASLDTCTRQLCGGVARTQTQFYDILHNTPYLACCSVVQCNAKKWQLTQPPILPFKHQANNAYNWKIMLDTATRSDAPSRPDKV